MQLGQPSRIGNPSAQSKDVSSLSSATPIPEEARRTELRKSSRKAQTPPEARVVLGGDQPEIKLLPKAVTFATELDWQNSRLKTPLVGEVIYRLESEIELQSEFEILCATRAVFFKGEPRAAFVFNCQDARTRELCANRAEVLLMNCSKAETFIFHRANSPRGSTDIITSPWDARDDVSKSLPGILKLDDGFAKAAIKGCMGQDRQAYDAEVLRDFICDVGGFERHLGLASSFPKRFSDFVCTEKISCFSGVQFQLVFDDYGVYSMAEQSFKRISRIIINTGNGCPLQLIVKTAELVDFVDTEQHPKSLIMTVWSRWNSMRTRAAMVLFLAMLCRIKPDQKSLDIFGISPRDMRA